MEKSETNTESPALSGIASTTLFDNFLGRKKEAEWALMDNEPDPAVWISRPDKAGWWLWLENGNHARTELLLVGDRGTHIADDDDWEQAVGRAPSDARGESENYWEGTETTQNMMPGLWFYLSNRLAQAPATRAPVRFSSTMKTTPKLEQRSGRRLTCRALFAF